VRGPVWRASQAPRFSPAFASDPANEATRVWGAGATQTEHRGAPVPLHDGGRMRIHAILRGPRTARLMHLRWARPRGPAPVA
jgi:hypothetical protein